MVFGKKNLSFSSILLISVIFCLNSFIGLILICNGICNAIASYIFGGLVKYIDRLGCFIIAAIINYATIFLMYFWEPVDDEIYILYIIAGLWGIAGAVWQSQVIGKILII